MSSQKERIFSPVIPIPRVFDRQKRIAELKDYLNVDHHKPQHDNLKKIIELYESGEKMDHFTSVWVKDGKVVTQEQALATMGSGSLWVEVSSGIICHELLLTSEFRRLNIYWPTEK